MDRVRAAGRPRTAADGTQAAAARRALGRYLGHVPPSTRRVRCPARSPGGRPPRCGHDAEPRDVRPTRHGLAPSVDTSTARRDANARFRVVRSTGGMQFARLANHFLDLGNVLLLELDLLAGVFLKPHALVNYEREQVVVLAKRGVLVIQGFLENLNDVVLVRLDQLADLQRRMPAKGGYVLAGHRGVAHALRGLAAHPADDRNARVAEDHQRVMYVAHHAREFELEDGVEAGDDFLGVDRVVFAGHASLLVCASECESLTGRRYASRGSRCQTERAGLD